MAPIRTLEGPTTPALLLHSEPSDLFNQLAGVLWEIGVPTCHAYECTAVKRHLLQPNKPRLVFTSATLPDGDWRDVLMQCASAGSRVSLIVVTAVVDTPLCIDALECGADYVIAPFEAQDIAHLVQCWFARLSSDHDPWRRRIARHGVGPTDYEHRQRQQIGISKCDSAAARQDIVSGPAFAAA